MSNQEIVAQTQGQQDPEVHQALKDNAIVFLTGTIEEGHLEVCNDLLFWHYQKDYEGEIHLLINSPGGQVSVGWSIIDVMNFIRLPVRTVALGMCCSMATDIFANGDHRTMGEHSTLMIHPHSSFHHGSYSSLLAAKKMDDIEHKRRVLHYLNNTNLSSIAEVEEKLFDTKGDDLFLDPRECLDLGLCDEIATADKAKRRKEYRTFLGANGIPVKARSRTRRKRAK